MRRNSGIANENSSIFSLRWQFFKDQLISCKSDCIWRMTSWRFNCSLFYWNLFLWNSIFAKSKEGQGCPGRMRTTIKETRKRGWYWRLCVMVVWPVDYGAETSAGASLQPVLDSVLAYGYKEKDGAQNREGSMPSTRRRKREPRRMAAIEEED